MSDPKDVNLDACGCCGSDDGSTTRYNRPGLPAVGYRLGTHATFLKRMVQRLTTDRLPDGDHAGERPLANLTTRSTDDPSIALLDAAAVAGDVLSFYQERIANEGFLRTATERRSVLELARAVGFELSAGVAATTFIAFTVDDTEGGPTSVRVPPGTKVQSIPPQDKLPQTFETVEEITARPGWNELRPLQTETQSLQGSSVYLQGTSTGLKAGDALLIVFGNGNACWTITGQVTEVASQAHEKRTLVRFSSDAITAASSITLPPPGDPQVSGVPQDEANVTTYILGRSWSEKDLRTFLELNGWDAAQLVKQIATRRAAGEFSAKGTVHSFRARAGMFGHNAPRWALFPKPDYTRGGGVSDPYSNNWDANPPTVWQNSQRTAYHASKARLYLERSIQEIVPDSWVILEQRSGDNQATRVPFRVQGVREDSLADYGMSAKVTGLDLARPDGTVEKSSALMARTTTAHVQSAQLATAEAPLAAALAKDSISLTLDRLAVGLNPGQGVALTGERADAPGVMASELLLIADITHRGGFTILTLERGLQHSYLRDTVRLNANSVRATHGETVKETLGSGDSSRPHQRFSLKRPPLTYVPAANAAGGSSTLKVRVNGLLWTEASSLYGLAPPDRKYVIRIDDDANAALIFGDGEKGARIPSGTENVVATYRTGTGLGGEVAAGTLTMLQSRPLGIKGASNPLAASGAADPSTTAQARRDAPLTVLTLGRIVSLTDHENFARAFNGIGKARAVPLWTGAHTLVHITVAGANGRPVDTGGELYENLVDAIDAARDPAQRVLVGNFLPAQFNVEATVIIDTDRDPDVILPAAAAALREHFSFDRRCFAQPVSAAEVITVIQKVEGIVSADLDALYRCGSSAVLEQLLPAGDTFLDDAGQIVAAELLLVNAAGIKVAQLEEA